MSINSLTNSAAARRNDIEPLNRPPKGLQEIASAANRIPSTQAPSAAQEGGGVYTTFLAAPLFQQMLGTNTRNAHSSISAERTEQTSVLQPNSTPTSR
jgi:hypothetical protein